MKDRLLKNKFFWIILIVVFVTTFSFIRFSSCKPKVDFSETDSIAAKNDSLQKVVNQLDSILKISKDKYETQRDSISNQSVDDDCDFFSEYLSKKHR